MEEKLKELQELNVSCTKNARVREEYAKALYNALWSYGNYNMFEEMGKN